MDEAERKRRGPIGQFFDMTWPWRIAVIVGFVVLVIVALFAFVDMTALLSDLTRWPR